MKVAWTPKSLTALKGIHDHVASDQPGNAKLFVDRLTQKARSITLAPYGGRLLRQYGRADVRETYEGEYRIIYRIRENRIDILSVRHMARLLPKHLKNL